MKNSTDLKNKKLLLIVESPNKCKTISDILKKAGYNHVTVSASLGHILKLKDNRKSYKNSGVYPNEDFKLDLVIDDDKKKLVEELKILVKKADLVYLMSDSDREGAMIADSLKNTLKLTSAQYRRAVTQEITPKAVVHAIENPIPLEEDLIEAAKTRLTIDKLIGYSLSPAARLQVGAKSVGRCQSVGLKLVTDREREILDFKPEEYYELFLNFKKDNQKFKAKYIGTAEKSISKIPSYEQLQEIIAGCSDKYFIKDVQIRERFESPKPPFCTATYQQEAANKFNLKIKDAMSIAQKLFEGISIEGNHVGLISYHRTDCEQISAEFLPQLKDYVCTNFSKDSYIGPRAVKKSEAAQEGHECLRVVDVNMTPEKAAKYIKNELHLKVYKLIWQRTVAAVLPNASFEDTVYTIENNGQLFKMNSLRLVKPGFKVIYDYLEDDSTEEQLLTKAFQKDEHLADCQLDPKVLTTTPPARYTEASLVKKLKDLEIGRPSTFATIVETILNTSRGYCTLEDKHIVPTDKGMVLSGFLNQFFSNLINLQYTGQLEEKLDRIANGEITRLDVLKEFFDDLQTALEVATKQAVIVPEDKNPKVCPLCGKTLVIRRSRWGKLFYG